jgi:hypothetical protein
MCARTKFILGIYHHPDWPGYGKENDHNMYLVLALDNNVSIRSWHRNGDLHIALVVTT